MTATGHSIFAHIKAVITGRVLVHDVKTADMYVTYRTVSVYFGAVDARHRVRKTHLLYFKRPVTKKM